MVVVFSFFILFIIWIGGTSLGQDEAARGECTLARWLGHEDELPLKPAKTPEPVKESAPEEIAPGIDRLVAAIRFSEDQQLRKNALEKRYEEGIVATTFVDAQEKPYTLVSGSNITALLQMIRHSADKKKRTAALSVLDQLGLVETL